ncbi:NADH-quinone oxidoreductase subunit J family protein [Sphingobacterium corticibacter]|uniref:NADH-quinone oxidoreductase subunit J n=1 Tax=Sphingobacterium corticibacter TaxID=2171749 RepID=A0A2T8HHA1_9SPHI|nr:NADH-quinone oxidoreductase subunit J [Sphingobacterium corticibacter]PVH24816.1 NADH-quinone oxidoreductase subunit N [Sphingobacterium corticibacter]
MDLFLFYAFAFLAITSALLVVSLKNTARALFLFFIVLFAMAGLYLFALADFVAITQVLVYVGGVLILMIFAFMLSNKELLSDLQDLSGSFITLPNWQSLALSLGFLGLMSYGIWQWDQAYSPAWMEQNIRTGQIILSRDNNINQLGMMFMSRYILPFEIISIFLMMTLIGAAHIARKGDEA